MNRLGIIVLSIVVLAAAVGAGWYFLAAPKVALTRTPGTITGVTGYPSEGVPTQNVCVEPVSGGSPICKEVPELGDGRPVDFSIKVEPGAYYVYAVLTDPAALGSDLGGYKAYYTQFVICGLRHECTDHSKVVVSVGAGQTVTDVRPHDWYQ